MPGPRGSARQHGGSPPPGAVDFSAPANPLGPPPSLREAVRSCAEGEVYLRYPTAMYSRLLDAVSSYLSVDADQLLLLNGTAEALSLAPLALGARNLVVVEPNFGDHRLLAEATGINYVPFPMTRGEEGFHADFDELARLVRGLEGRTLVVMSRPNNPTGYAAPLRSVEDLASALPNGAYLVVDEAFIELSGAEPTRPAEGVLILRSLTKSLASPGLRLGAVVSADARALEAVASAAQAWPIDSITACAYARVLEDPSTRDHVRRGRELTLQLLPWFAGELARAGLRVYRGSAPFVLVQHPQVPNPGFQRSLAERGFYVRDASSFAFLDSTFSRISLLARELDEALVRAVREVLGRGA